MITSLLKNVMKKNQILYVYLLEVVYLTKNTTFFCLVQALKVKENEETQMISELQRTQTILLTRLAALGAGGKLLPPVVTALASATTPSSVSSNIPPSSVASSTNHNGTTKQASNNAEEEENMVIDVMHDSEDDTSSTTSGSDGGCTSTSHKNSNFEYH